MYEQIQNPCQPLTYLEQGVILHPDRKINPFLLSSVLYSGIPAFSYHLVEETAPKGQRLEKSMTIKSRAFANTTEL